MIAVVLERVKYSHNLAAAIRAAACFGAESVYWTGKRFAFADGERLPREERMKGYRSVRVSDHRRPLDDICDRDAPFRPVPVCVELTPSAQPLWTFGHPMHAAYVFGPEDGHVSQALRAACHRFVYIPAHHCLNLAAAVNVVLAHRALQLYDDGYGEPLVTPARTEGRGAIEVPGLDGK
jgi:tRNA(Leu) C34 or U34 (ribose-2'-O)-methylase TrmL